MLRFLTRLVLVSLCACSSKQVCVQVQQDLLAIDLGPDVPAQTAAVLLGAAELELIALDPDWPTAESKADPACMHGYGVRGRALVRDLAVRSQLLQAFAAGNRENNNTVAACFNPRHGLRAELDGETAEIIICFECLQFYVFDGTERIEQGKISASPASVFNGAYTGQGLSIAGI